MSDSRKLLYWEGSSRADFSKFPLAAQRVLGVKLFAVQLGDYPSGTKPLTGVGNGVYELRSNTSGDAYRVVCVAGRVDSIFVLHAFKKNQHPGLRRQDRTSQ